VTPRQVFHRLLEHPWVYGASQHLVPFARNDCRAMVARHIALPEGAAVLDIGCGVGAHRSLFPGARYTGVDINPDYIARANRTYGSGFYAMDAGHLEFPDNSFDAAVSIAMCHHLDDDLVRAMAGDSLRVLRAGGALHIIDAVLPEPGESWFKTFVFSNDRGRHQRSEAAMRALAAACGRITAQSLRIGVTHKIIYLRIEPNLAA